MSPSAAFWPPCLWSVPEPWMSRKSSRRCLVFRSSRAFGSLAGSQPELGSLLAALFPKFLLGVLRIPNCKLLFWRGVQPRLGQAALAQVRCVRLMVAVTKSQESQLWSTCAHYSESDHSSRYYCPGPSSTFIPLKENLIINNHVYVCITHFGT